MSCENKQRKNSSGCQFRIITNFVVVNWSESRILPFTLDYYLLINSVANGKDYYQMLILLEIVVTIIHKQGRNLYYIDNEIFKMYSE